MNTVKYYNNVIYAARDTIARYKQMIINKEIDSFGLTSNCKYCMLFMRRGNSFKVCNDCPLSNDVHQGCGDYKTFSNVSRYKRCANWSIDITKELRARIRFHQAIIKRYNNKLIKL